MSDWKDEFKDLIEKDSKTVGRKPKAEAVDFKEEFKKQLEPKQIEVLQPSKGLSTGSTLLNLACSGDPNWGFMPGYYYFLVGDSNSGKSFLSLTCMAEACLNKNFDDYDLIYDGPEYGALMDLKKFFGKGVAKRLKPPKLSKDKEPIHSYTVQEFYYNADAAFDNPTVYVLDSMDSLDSDEDSEKFDKQREAHEKGKEITGSYGTAKAKANSQGIRRLIRRLQESKSILIIISQTRDRIGFGFEKNTRSGGRALRFYAATEMWSSVIGKRSKTVRGEKGQQGIDCEVHVKRSRFTGKERTIEMPIYWSSGIDDLGSCIEFLTKRKHWKGGKDDGEGKNIDALEFEFKGNIEQLIKKIEEENKESELKQIVSNVWNEIENSLAVERKRRYE